MRRSSRSKALRARVPCARPFLLWGLLLLGCRSAASSEDAPESRPTSQAQSRKSEKQLAAWQLANEREPCRRALCIGGPPASVEANADLAEACKNLSGVIRHCEGERCRSAWPQERWSAGLDALITSLDSNQDGKVDAADRECSIDLAGWSTGAATIAGPLAKALVEDPRMTRERALVDRLLLVAPHGEASLVVPEIVDTAFIYRNSMAPPNDCSAKWAAGPWLSPAPECGPATTCYDYDYSYEPALAFVGRRGARGGAAVDHCNVMGLVAKLVPDNLGRGVEAIAEHVPRYSDGNAGGREH